MKHYEMTSAEYGTKKSYEFYSNVSKFIKKTGPDLPRATSRC